MAKKKKKKVQNIKKHKRINDIFFGPIERPLIAWLVKRMPRWVTPDVLTSIGFFAAILIGVSYWLTNSNKNYLWLATFGFMLNWFGDSLDGNLARYRKIERPRYGFFIDHIVDTVSEVAIFLGLGLSPYVDYTLASLALIAYLCMTIQVYITTSIRGVFRISYGKLGPTEARVIAMIANTVIFFIGNPNLVLPFGIEPSRTVSLYNLIVFFVVILLSTIFFISAFIEGKRLAKKDRKKWLKKHKTDKK